MFLDQSPKSAKMSNIISQMLWSRDRFHSNEILQFVNTRPIYYCTKCGKDYLNMLWVIVIYIMLC